MALHRAPLQHPVFIAGAEPLFIKPRPGRAWQDTWAGRDSQGAEGRPDVLIPAFTEKESLLPVSEEIECGCGATWRISPAGGQHSIMSIVQASRQAWSKELLCSHSYQLLWRVSVAVPLWERGWQGAPHLPKGSGLK